MGRSSDSVDNLIVQKNLGIVIKLGSFAFNNFSLKNILVISWISQPAVHTTQASTTCKHVIMASKPQSYAFCTGTWLLVGFHGSLSRDSEHGCCYFSTLIHQMWYRERAKFSPGDWHSHCTKAQCWVLVHSEKSPWEVIFHAGECHVSLAGLFTGTEKLRVRDKT